MIKEIEEAMFGTYRLPKTIMAMSDDGGGGDAGGDSGEGDAGGGDDAGAPTPVTFGDILPTDMMDDKGNFPKALSDFTTLEIPGAVKDDETHQAFHTKLGSLAKAYADTKSMVGGMIKIPGKGASEEEVAAFRSKLGVPDAPDKYELNLPENEDNRLLFDENTLTGFKDKAHAAGYTNEQVQLALDFQTDMVQEQMKALDDMAAEGTAALQKEWGDKYDENIKGAEAMVSKYFPENAQKDIAASMGNNPDFVRGLVEIYNRTKESGDLKGGDSSARDTTVEALSAEINDLMSSDKYAKADPATHKKVADLMARKQKLLGTYKENAYEA